MKSETQTKNALPEIVHLVEIASPADRVYEALTTQTGLSSWWTQDTHAEPKVGAVNEFGFHGPHMAVFKLRVEELVPGKRVLWSSVQGPPDWNGTKIAFQILPAATGSVLRFSHGPFATTDGGYGVYNFNWGVFLLSLKNYLETGKGMPAPKAA